MQSTTRAPSLDGRRTASPQSWNEYAYVGNQPLRNVDPLGLFCPPGESCAAMDNGAANAAFGLFSQSNEFGLLSIPIYAQTGYIQTGSNAIASVDGLPVAVSVGEPMFTPTYAIVGSGFDLAGNFGPLVWDASTRGAALTARGGGIRFTPLPKSNQNCGAIVAAGAAQTALDLVGTLPIAGEVAEAVKTGAAVGSTGVSLASSDGVGASFGLTGLSIETLRRNPELLESLAGEIPVFGRFVSLGAAGYDIYATYRACRG